MFGRRRDGRELRTRDYIIKMTPMLMTKRSDAQVFIDVLLDANIATDYIHKKHAEGIKISTMAIVIAGFVRTISQFPAINRFVVGKRIYVRNELTCSFAVLKERTVEEVIETTVKLHFDPHDTIYDVARRINDVIERESVNKELSLTDKVASAIFSIPVLPAFVVSLIKYIDRLGLMGKMLIEASPFHTSMFITNMASINMGKVFHHIYDFGTTSMFIGMGKKEEHVYRKQRDKSIESVRVIPLGLTIDERICPGATYAMALHYWEECMRHPERLEVPPETVRFDNGLEYSWKEPEAK